MTIGELLSRFDLDTLRLLLVPFLLLLTSHFGVLAIFISSSIDSMYSKTIFDHWETLLRFIMASKDYRYSLLSANNFKLDKSQNPHGTGLAHELNYSWLILHLWQWRLFFWASRIKDQSFHFLEQYALIQLYFSQNDRNQDNHHKMIMVLNPNEPLILLQLLLYHVRHLTNYVGNSVLQGHPCGFCMFFKPGFSSLNGLKAT